MLAKFRITETVPRMNSVTEDYRAPSPDSDVVIVYDGECPFCKQYMQLLRLRASCGNVRLVDARSDDPHVDEVVRRNYDLDQGMIVTVGDQYYHGSEALQVLAMLSTRMGWFNRFNFFVFRSKRVAAALYPTLRGGRNLALRLLGRKPINSEPL